MKELDNTNMCSLLRKKLFEEDGPYHKIWLALQEDNELTAAIRNRQLHICRNGKKVLILAGKSAPKALCDDAICSLIQSVPLAEVTDTHKTTISMYEVIPQNVVCSQELRAFFAEHLGRGFHFKAEFQNWLHNNAGKTYREAVEAVSSSIYVTSLPTTREQPSRMQSNAGTGRKPSRVHTDMIGKIKIY